MALSKKQQRNADRLKRALEEADADDALKTAREMGDAVRAGDEEKLAELKEKAQRRGWLE